jgi:hypothetical protein
MYNKRPHKSQPPRLAIQPRRRPAPPSPVRSKRPRQPVREAGAFGVDGMGGGHGVSLPPSRATILFGPTCHREDPLKICEAVNGVQPEDFWRQTGTMPSATTPATPEPRRQDRASGAGFPVFPTYFDLRGGHALTTRQRKRGSGPRAGAVELILEQSARDRFSGAWRNSVARHCAG